MFKKVASLLIVSLFIVRFCSAQYTDDAKDKTDTTGSQNNNPLFNFRQNGVMGLEFMLNGSSGYIFGELSPFVGVKVLKPVLLGGGAHGSILSGYKFTELYYGVHGFGRLIIGNQFFLHAEYRLLNGYVPGSTVRRQWVSSPIMAVGFMNGSSSWFMIGYATNVNFQNINPFGPLVYRIGFYF